MLLRKSVACALAPIAPIASNARLRCIDDTGTRTVTPAADEGDARGQ